MATLAMFYGIIIKMNKELGAKHHKPHRARGRLGGC